MKEKFVSLTGDLKIQSEFGINTPRKLIDIFMKLGIKSAIKSTKHNLVSHLGYVLKLYEIDLINI